MTFKSYFVNISFIFRGDIIKIKYIIEIFLTLLFVLISIPLWTYYNDTLKYDDGKKKYLAYQEDLKLGYTNDFVTYNQIGLKKKPNDANIMIYNPSKNNNEGILILSYNKTSELDYRYFKITINDQVYYLEDLLLKSTVNNFVFQIDKLNIHSYNFLEYNIKLEIKDNVIGNNIINKKYQIQYSII